MYLNRDLGRAKGLGLELIVVEWNRETNGKHQIMKIWEMVCRILDVWDVM